MILTKAFVKDLEVRLEPAQGFVSAMLILIIVGSLYMLFSKNAVLRTSWAAWMIIP